MNTQKEAKELSSGTRELINDIIIEHEACVLKAFELQTKTLLSRIEGLEKENKKLKEVKARRQLASEITLHDLTRST